MNFDVAAEAYDRFMGRFSVPLAAIFADWVGVVPPARALDVGCGTGALTRILADRLGSAAVCGVDPSAAFVTATRERLPGVDVRQAAAESLPFDDGAFEAALASLVVHFMADPATGTRELARVTRPGGTVAACVWDFVGGRAPQTAFFRAFAAVVPGVEDETGRAGARRGDLVRLLRAAGCHDVEERELTVEVGFATFDEWWQPYTLGVAPAGRQLAALGDAEQTLVRERARAALGEGPIRVAATAWAARATV